MKKTRKHLKAQLQAPARAVSSEVRLGLAGIGSLAIPGVGPFIAAGPILAAASGAAVGATLGGITGGLVGLGIPEYEAKVYEGKIKEGNILLSVHTEDSSQIDLAKRIFEEAGAQSISTTGEASVKDTPRSGKTPAVGSAYAGPN